ncbi:UDP-3-O-[3-hydroxymyristoyl] glucosamine N-acyltransferase [Polaromonas sp. OV174]|uniref:UDP-3-O-(3-hydroxymyristoyl)glucosamine N-acyltransferase n=1 Tax=Polaromonas sp. OV174 TaxID=1855300 RepID=UPI0008EA1AED|nr:UDP-3-O-(3-hydroxymyristoyl)glucosamine N-acyltransferase [Polaromonas sp. OV174]SFB97593.1 UDP-3-O-[3-hydroxymyristoyl] glucosamine N-acyltransferase [Polaromonas sp. OV174]
MTLRLVDIVQSLAGKAQAELLGDPELLIQGLSTLEAAGPQDLSFLSHPKYLGKLAQSGAACVVVGPAAREAALSRGPCIVVDDPYHYFALITQLWKARLVPAPAPSLHPAAYIDPGAILAPGVSVGAFACIAAGAVIGEGAQIAEHCVIGRDVVIGAGSRLSARVTVAYGCRVGERCLIHPGAVIGADGFGFAPHDGEWVKIEQLGAVQIGNDVEIGANTCIDRGALQDTVLEDGVKLDNLVQIGHNVRIGRHSAMAGCAGVAGSATIGAHCTVGGGAIVLGHLSLADHVHVSAASVVTRSISKPGHYTGLFPIDDNAAWEKNAATLKQLHSLRERLKQTEKTLARDQGTFKEKS